MRKTKSSERAMAADVASSPDPAASAVVPDDRRSFVSVAVFAVGVGLLLPWNMSTTVNGYWDFKFR